MQKRGKRLGEAGVERAVAREKTLIEQADVQLDVLIVDFSAFFGRADRMAEPQAGIPERLEECREWLGVAPARPPLFSTSTSRSISE